MQRKRKTELVCSIVAGTSGIIQTDVVIARHLERPYMHLSLVSPSEGGTDTSHGLTLYSSNNSLQSQHLVLPKDFLVRQATMATKTFTRVASLFLHVSVATSVVLSSRELPPLSC